MGKKTKVAQQRKDKFYKLAKETGYRSRAAFKLLQINKKFEFLSKTKYLVDLCAAPGSWLQVASRFMPQIPERIIVGVDLDPIKSIPGVVTFENDIRTIQCLSQIKNTLKGNLADVVLHDGAPNVGTDWKQDAFSQNDLVLSATKLACQILKKGGLYITKVFRSADYNSLLWTFHQIFKKVSVTKPVASRLQSAEIFVICEGYLAPEKLDSKLLQTNTVFEDLGDKKIINPLNRKQLLKKKKALGYDTNSVLLYKKCSALEFINSEEPLKLLSENYEIVFKALKDGEDEEEMKIFEQHPDTTSEIRAVMTDLKTIGPKEFKALLRWRLKMRDFAMMDKSEEEDEKEEVDPLDDPNTTLEEKQKYLRDVLEHRVAQREKQKLKKQRKKLSYLRKLVLSMGMRQELLDELNLEEIEANHDFFRIAKLKNNSSLVKFLDPGSKQTDKAFRKVIETSDAEKNKKHAPIEAILGFDQFEEKDEFLDKFLDLCHEKYLENHKNYDKQKVHVRLPEAEDLDSLSNYKSAVADDEDNPFQEDGKHDLLLSDVKSLKAKNIADAWFETDDIFGGIEDEEEDKKLVDDNIKKYKRKFGLISDAEKNKKNEPSSKRQKKESREYNAEGESNYFEIVPQVEDNFSDYESEEAAEMLLTAAKLKDPASRHEVIDRTFTRWMRDDSGTEAPDWFKLEEKLHARPIPVVTRDEVLKYKQQLKAINSRPMKKIAEAIIRKKKQKQKALDRVRSKAKQISEMPDLTPAQKRKEVQSLVRSKLGKPKEKKLFVVSKNKSSNRMATNRKVQVLDRRMKKDKLAKNKKHNKRIELTKMYMKRSKNKRMDQIKLRRKHRRAGT